MEKIQYIKNNYIIKSWTIFQYFNPNYHFLSKSAIMKPLDLMLLFCPWDVQRSPNEKNQGPQNYLLSPIGGLVDWIVE